MASLKALRIRALILASGFVLTASSIISVSCGDSRVNYFPSQIGQSWDMIADGTGDITHFEIVNPPTSDRTDLVNIHITKTQARAYWQNNSAGAELWWGMHQLGGSTLGGRLQHCELHSAKFDAVRLSTL